MSVFEYILSPADKSNPLPFNDFIIEHLPSKLIVEDKVIISRAKPAALPINLITHEFQMLTKVIESSVLEIGANNSITEGKWMLLYLQNEDFDLKWIDILTSFLRGNLGIRIEFFARNANYFGLFVHTADFRDTEDLDLVAEEIVRLGLKKGRIYYKPEIYSILGIRNPNQWGLQASIYQVD